MRVLPTLPHCQPLHLPPLPQRGWADTSGVCFCFVVADFAQAIIAPLSRPKYLWEGLWWACIAEKGTLVHTENRASALVLRRDHGRALPWAIASAVLPFPSEETLRTLSRSFRHSQLEKKKISRSKSARTRWAAGPPSRVERATAGRRGSCRWYPFYLYKY